MERTGRELLIASRKYAIEDRATSWWHLWTTLVTMIALVVIASANLPWFVCLTASVFAGLVMVRMFIVYHDYMHGAILRGSLLAKCLMHGYGLLILSPPNMWKHSHDDHHKNNCKSFGAELGAFPIMTTQAYAEATGWQRLGYRIVRNPIIIVFGYLTSFLWSTTLVHFLKNPARNYSAGLSILLHVGVAVLVGFYSVQALLLGLVLPMFIGSAIGTYLFYAQHNFPGMKRKESPEWDYVYAAICSSSYMKMSRIMHWFTGNIGYHHVHHLNAKIPFYRLPEAMAGLKELQSPTATSLSPIDIFRCLRLKLWDPKQERLLTFREASRLSRRNRENTSGKHPLASHHDRESPNHLAG